MVVEFPWWIYIVLVWTLFWKGVGAWRAAKNNQLIWFVSFFIFNTFGILPLVYLQWFQRDWNKGIPGKQKGECRSVSRAGAKRKIKKKRFPSLV